jgi:hypothetical protein
MLPRIIFLDIDGPVIPGHLYDVDPVAPYHRLLFDRNAIARLNRLCAAAGARIVTNSMHNFDLMSNRSLRDDLVAWGVDPRYIHANWRTSFPMVNYASNPNPRRGWGRWLGISKWIEHNGECDWVCFDDRSWTDDPRLVLVDFEHGITDANVAEAVRQFAAQVAATV